MAVEQVRTVIDDLVRGPLELRVATKVVQYSIPEPESFWKNFSVSGLVLDLANRIHLNRGTQESVETELEPEVDLIKHSEVYDKYRGLLDVYGEDLRMWGAQPFRNNPVAGWIYTGEGNFAKPSFRATVSKRLDSESEMVFVSVEDSADTHDQRSVSFHLLPNSPIDVIRYGFDLKRVELPRYSVEHDLNALTRFVPHLEAKYIELLTTSAK